MAYFQNITKLEQAKQYYRKLAKQLHPDKGGSAIEFQQMQQEYRALLLNLKTKQTTTVNQNDEQADIMEELGKLAKVLIEKQIPQKYLKQKVRNSQSLLVKGLFSEILNQLDKLNHTRQ